VVLAVYLAAQEVERIIADCPMVTGQARIPQELGMPSQKIDNVLKLAQVAEGGKLVPLHLSHPFRAIPSGRRRASRGRVPGFRPAKG
jgi:hypothetical protein